MPVPAACLIAGALAATPATMAGVPLDQLHGRGAVVPFTEYEAENACTTGTPIGPSRALYTIAAEASNRRAVRLDTAGQYVEFTLARPANAVTARYAIADSEDGSGQDSTAGIYVAGKRIAALALTSRYGWFYGAYPFTNLPSDGRPHHVFDEARTLLGRTLQAGERVRIALGPQDRLPVIVDVADFELVPPPLVPPAGALHATRLGADPTGSSDSSAALEAGIAAARTSGRPLWLDPGTYRVSRHLTVDRVTIDGAGPWYSIITGSGAGLYGRSGAGSRGVHLAGFAVIGDVRDRDDRVKLAGIGGTIGGGSTIENLWLQHHKSGVWLDGPSSGVTLSRLRILDNSADGINLRDGVTGATIENVFVRNSGDDGIALWSHYHADAHDLIVHNTVTDPILANGIALYGGRDIRIGRNLVADTLTQGGGIHVGNRFAAVPLSGTIGIADNLLLRTGSFDPNWRVGVGALWFYALDAPIDAQIEVSRNTLSDSTFEALQFVGKPIRGVRLDANRIDGAALAMQLQSPGAATWTGGEVNGLQDAAVARCNPGFELHGPSLSRASLAWCAPLDPRVVEQRLSR